MRAGRQAWLAGAALVLIMVGCGGGDDSGTASESGATFAAVPDTASDPGAQVARRIVKAATLDEAVAATREGLTIGGLTISDFTGTNQPAIEPASEIIILPPEAVLLAHEARQRATTGRMTLDDFAGMLADFGWPFEGEGMPGEQLMAVMAEWVRQARLAPNEPRNFTPLFMADMGRRQIPAVDLASDSTDPGEVRLGFLEMQLFAAAMTRGSGEPVQTGLWEGVPVVLASYGATGGVDACADIKKWLGTGLEGKAVGAGVKYQVSKELQLALVKSGLTEAAAKQVSKALSVLKSAMKIVKLSELYGSASIVLDHASEVPAERPAPGGEVYASIRAQAGIATDKQEEYKKSLKSAELATGLRNCLEAAGLPTWSDVSDVGADVDAWRVHWHLGKGAPKHAWHVRERNDWFAYGQRSMLVKRKTPTSGEAVYTFKLVPEPAPGHPGDDLKAEVTVRAELKTAKPPGLGTAASAAFGPLGLVKSLVDAGSGWFQEMLTFDTYITVPIVYHEPGISILIEDENHMVIDFGLGQKGNALFASKAAERSRHVYAGSMRLGEDSVWHGQVLVTASGTYTTADEEAAKAKAAKYSNIDGMSWEQTWKAVGDLLGEIPYCHGRYDGAQLFAVEGGFVSGPGGKDQIDLGFIPVGPPEYYNSSADCPWPADRSNAGFDILPARLVRGERGAIVIDPPLKGRQRVYRQVSNMENFYSSTVTTVGADFTTGDN